MTGALPTGREYRFARRLLAQRRERERLLGPELSTEPAWAMLVALFVAHEEGEPAAVETLCGEAGAPRAAALRWLETLEAEGKVSRSAAGDSAGAHVNLSPGMADRLRRLFRTWAEDPL